ncbi:MAG: dethiobiotin synthase [Pseudomonadota bacterium]
MPSPIGIFLVGTDTGVGKTAVAQGLLRLARRRGFRLAPYKPVETGWHPGATDARRLLEAATLTDLTLEDVCPHPFAPPVAPSVAARLAGQSLSAAAILRHGRELASRADGLLVECAGGLLTPYAPGLTSASLAELFAMDVLVVSANRLGTVNHTALTVAEARRRRLRLAGAALVQVSRVPEPDHASNAAEIHALTGVALLGTLGHCPTQDPDALADAVARDLDLTTILDGALA